MNTTKLSNAADKLNAVELVPFMLGITWILISFVGLYFAVGWIGVTLLR
jgi:hypothetical protein